MSELIFLLPSRHRIGVLFLLANLAVGCGWRPSAPPLQDGPVYKDQREGFRFFVPEGWKQRARGVVPPGKILSERVLTEYKALTSESPAALMVSVMDVPTSTPLSDYVTKNTMTGEKWILEGPVEDFTVNAAPAARITYIQHHGKFETVREIVAIRRGERVYFFKGFYTATDAKSRKAIRSTIDTIVW